MVRNAMDRIWLESCLVSLAILRLACVSWYPIWFHDYMEK